jgi:pyruvate,water dikinase
MNYIRWLHSIAKDDLHLVGGKNASLAHMMQDLSAQGILIPRAFALTTCAYRFFLEHNNLKSVIDDLSLHDSSTNQLSNIRLAIIQAHIPDAIIEEIEKAYQELSAYYAVLACDVAVRSSATSEDLAHASGAGQQETFLNVRSLDILLVRIKECFASLFTPRAVLYRASHNLISDNAISVGIQKMVRSDLASSGTAFSLDPESGYSKVIIINGAYGLGQALVQGNVTPDEWIVFKPALHQSNYPIIKKKLGEKKIKIMYGGTLHASISSHEVDESKQRQFCLSEAQVIQLAHQVAIIEDYYSKMANTWTPVDIEWAIDGIDKKIYILQARPETIHANKQTLKNNIEQYQLLATQKNIVITGYSVGKKIVTGRVRIITSLEDIALLKEGDILVTSMTDPDWLPAFKKVTGIITDQGGRTCHAAIVSRELAIPAIVGTQHATNLLYDGQEITLDCSQGITGYVYQGLLNYQKKKIEIESTSCPVDIMLNLADPDRAFALSCLPVQGVGLARIEFIINQLIKVHPMALINPELVIDRAIASTINQLTHGYDDKKEFFIDILAQGIATIAAAFYPRQVIVRFSDFKSNEYRNLIGGVYFEPVEENPMIGFRGASRYYHERYTRAFYLECQAIKRVRESMGLGNVKVMIPFVRTLHEGKKVIEIMTQYGLKKGEHGLEIIMMCEIPANVILLDQFSELFDGFSIGSNDLTQLTLGIDRDSGILASSFDERDRAVMKLIEMAIESAKKNNRSIGICGQAPSDHPEFARFLIDQGIHSISLNPDSVIPFLQEYQETQKVACPLKQQERFLT